MAVFLGGIVFGVIATLVFVMLIPDQTIDDWLEDQYRSRK